MLDISAALSDAYKRTRYLIWERRSFGRWWRYALLSALTSGGGGGGFNFRVPLQLLQASKKETAMVGLALSTCALGDLDAGLVPLILGVGIGLFLFALFFAWLSSCAQFVMIESIVYDRHVLGESFGRLKGNGTGFFFWTILVTLLCLIPMGLVIIGAVGSGFAVAQSAPGLIVLISMAALAVVAVMAIAMCAFFALTTQFVVPVAYRQRIGLNPAWSLVWQTLSQRKGDTCLFLLVLMGVAMAGAFGVMMGVMLVGGVVALVSGLLLGMPAFFLYQQHMVAPAVLCGVLFGLIVFSGIVLTSLSFQTPLTVFTRCFGIYIMQQLMPEMGLLPLGGRPEQIQEDPILSEDPQPLGALPEDSWQRPEF
jgi:hypothetical protein